MSSRYKNALHFKTFDRAVKKFRQKENEETEKLAKQITPHAPKTHSLSSLPDAVKEAEELARRELERLPTQIIKQVRSFHDQMQFFVNDTGVAAAEVAGEHAPGRTGIPMQLRKLLDEIARLEEIGGRAKREILEDDDSRNVRLATQSVWFHLLTVVQFRLYYCLVSNVCYLSPML